MIQSGTMLKLEAIVPNTNAKVTAKEL